MYQPIALRANLRLILLLLWLLACHRAVVAEVSELASSVGPSPVELIEALDQLQPWINADPENGRRWNRYLKTDLLRGEIDRGTQADPYVVVQALRQYQSEAHGLDRPRFVAVRSALESWYSALKAQHSTDLATLAWVSRGDFQPLTPERFAPVRDALRDRARQLEANLNTNPTRAAAWKRYLKWELLQPYLDVEAQLNRQALKNLDLVLKQFRANQPGLELPMFTSTAEALQRYRSLALWAALAKSRDTRPLYDKTVQGLQIQLERHLEAATPETSWKIGRTIDLIEQLRCSPEFVASVRSDFGKPNLLIWASAETLDQLARRPVQQTRPIRDVILGAQVRGSADTVGQVSFSSLPAEDHIELAIHFEGEIVSRTVAHKKPVRVSSRGRTNFVAKKRVLISDDQFLAIPATVVAQTRTNIRSIQKTGGPLAANLIERIAWKKVCKSKPCSEQIASRKAERKVGSSLDEELLEKLVAGRNDYDRLIRLPLIRRGAHPEHLQMTSTDSLVRLQTRLATSGQLSSSSRGPATDLDNELTIQVHHSALDNYLPLVLAGLTIRQTAADQPPELIGDLPPWLKKLTLKEPETDDAGTADSAEDEVETQTDSQPDEQHSFTPGHITLNADRPVSVTFDDQNVSIRIRAAEIQADDSPEAKPYLNWDFIVTYRIERDGNGILLKRTGRIDVFPTGFDPRWDKKLSGQQSGFRTTLANNLNERAEKGEGFPEEIALEAIRLPLFGGVELTLVLEQLECDDGWLTVGWRMP